MKLPVNPSIPVTFPFTTPDLEILLLAAVRVS